MHFFTGTPASNNFIFASTAPITCISRARVAGVGNYTTIMWAGDQNVDFSYGDGLASTIPAALNMGMSGVSHV